MDLILRYIILHGPIFTDRDWDRFGCDVFKNRGYDVIPCELTEIIWPEATNKVASQAYQSSKRSIAVTTIEAARELIAGINPDDFVLCNMQLEPEAVPIFQLLTAYKIDFAVTTLSEVPTFRFQSGLTPFSLIEWLRRQTSDLRGHVYRYKELAKQIVSPRINLLSLRSPRWWIRAGEGHPYFIGTYPKCWLAESIETHSYDFEHASTIARTRKHAPLQRLRPYAVFIDEGFIGHPDFDYMNETSPVTLESYKEFVDTVSRRVESDAGLPMIVALHPRSNPETALTVYDGRTMVSGKTAELIADADLVVLTCSTSVSYAAYFRRPVLFVTTDQIDRDPYFGPFSARMASWFGLHPINIDHLTEDDRLTAPQISDTRFLDYERAFMRGSNAPDDPIWVTVADRVQMRPPQTHDVNENISVDADRT